MKKIKLKRSISRFIKIHILCARSAFIEKHAMQALNDSFTDLSKFLCQFIQILFFTIKENFFFLFILSKTS